MYLDTLLINTISVDMNFAAADETLLTLITQVQNSMGRLFNHRAKDFGLTRPQWRVISGLYGHSGVTQTELSEMISIARSPLGKIIDNLEAAGLVERRSDPDDRRVKRLHLTPAIEPLLEPTRVIARGLEDELLADLTERERADLRRALLTLQNAAEAALAAELDGNSEHFEVAELYSRN